MNSGGTMQYGHDTYLSVFTWRYGSEDMRRVWSLQNRSELQREIWYAAALAMHKAGLVTTGQLGDLFANRGNIDIGAILAKEKEIGHDIMAAILKYRDDAQIGGGVVHLGMTSEDNTSNLDIMLCRVSVELLIESLRDLLLVFADKIDEHADLVCCGYTHLQIATSTTVGYRLAQYAQDLLMDLGQLTGLRNVLLGKGLKGATGTRASFSRLLKGKSWTPEQLEKEFMFQLGLEQAYPVTGQTYPRKVDHTVLSALAGLAQSLHKFGFDVRLQQSSPFNEISEPRKKAQVGSTAMPWKRNPIHSENLDSLTRVVPSMVQVAWTNAAFAGLDRTLDESANRRIILPTSFLLMDEALTRANRIIKGLVVKEGVIGSNLEKYAVFTGTEAFLMHLVEKWGMDRQDAHEKIRLSAIEAWEAMEAGSVTTTLMSTLKDRFKRPSLGEIQKCLMEGARDVGDAPERARKFADKVRESVRSA